MDYMKIRKNLKPISKKEQKVVDKAVGLLKERYANGERFLSSDNSMAFIQLSMAQFDREVFSCLYLDNQHRLIAQEYLFVGAVDGIQVSTREVLRAALLHNASAVILAHNHPGGTAEPSTEDLAITKQLEKSLGMVGIRLLDHIVVGTQETTSIADLNASLFIHSDEEDTHES
jgi:DNA repair protein RadC